VSLETVIQENDPACEIDQVSVVIVGSFNPTIFQPDWLASNNLIREEEAEAADIEIIHKQITSFSIEWLKVQATHDRLLFAASDASKQGPLKDVVVGAMGLLEHTPVTALGLNSDSHYHMQSEAEWHQLGHHYVPKETWVKLLARPGTLSLSIFGARDDSKASRVTVKLEPSTQVRFGVFFNINNHFDVDPGRMGAGGSVRWLLETIDTEWEGFLAYRKKVANHLLSDFKR
jgi:hypothetical protein